jgi:hypothetical protein
MNGTGAQCAMNVRDLILTTAQEHAYRPSDLLQFLLRKHPEVGERQLQDALSALLAERVLELSADRYIMTRQLAAS